MIIERNNLKSTEYTKFISNGYLIEIIPEFTEDSKHPNMVVSIVNSSKLAYCHSTPGERCEMNIFKLPTANLSSKDPVVVSKQLHNYIDKKDIVASFTGKVWMHHMCASGKLEITITDREDDDAS